MNDLSPSERVRNLEIAVAILTSNQEKIGQELVAAMDNLNALLEQIKKAVEDWP